MHNRTKFFLVVFAAILLLPVGAGAATRPDDRGGIRGAAGAPAPAVAVRPDDRAGIRGVGTTSAVEAKPGAVRPHVRSVLRGAETDVVQRYLYSHAKTDGMASASGGFPWIDAAIGTALGAGFVLVAAHAVRVRRNRRRTAALA